jgi:hypothetical protein
MIPLGMQATDDDHGLTKLAGQRSNETLLA